MKTDDELPDTLRPPPEQLIGEGFELVATSIEKLGERFEKGMRGIALALGGIHSEQERDYGRYAGLRDDMNAGFDGMSKSLENLNQGVSQIARLLQIRDEDDQAFRSDIVGRIKTLEGNKKAQNGASPAE